MFSRFFLLLLDLLIFFLSFCLSISFKPAGLYYYIDNYSVPLVVFLFAWVIPSIISGKFLLKGSEFSPFVKRILLSNFITLAIVTSAMFFLYSYSFSRIIVVGTIGFATLFELMT